ncbi:Bifunctional protein pyrR [Rhodothermus marinus SG0.5JP17-172]|uniref:bifunctional pyr operon transcriptional regulator/uracil phosphoribosyltransferase PyrR n=1 Tax=Rhodothermus marinus TaxID=29549 RepID=UPI000223D48C|nr:bifunctional pyr operon transcriptional regulator/uracil phosphoribosyltransferase PyrR [Rhodothermus marinus]AEN72107.1 Bifunctional protein pyrR [Rhodothermus marinus SG0.5JP17-172]MBO2491101.1 bifunctional pyr operon transcriptional regulator/uracil phosphoribosyltransferase PyrR [Rhodothermus marinus]
MKRTRILTPEQVARILDRMAYEVLERNRGGEGLVVFGILQKGVAVAEALSTRLAQIEARDFPVNALDVRPYRDDRSSEAEVEDRSRLHIDAITDRHVLLVDDVLFTGRTVRAALDALLRWGRPRSVQLAVLIDRGHREFPIRADYVGRTVPTKYQERIVVVPEEGLAVYVEEA